MSSNSATCIHCTRQARTCDPLDRSEELETSVVFNAINFVFRLYADTFLRWKKETWTNYNPI
jgi:hypothetical protein